MSEEGFDQHANSPDRNISSGKNDISFEPGIHFPTDNILQKIDEGDLTVHCWNGEVADRLRSYNPQVIAIDSVQPVASLYMSQKDYSYEDKKWTWCWMPGGPKQINEKGDVIVVSGDSDFRSIASDLGQFVKTDEERSALYHIGRERDQQENKSTLLGEIAEGALGSGIAGLIAMGMTAEYMRYRANNALQKEDEKRPPRTFSRRKFLQAAGVGLATAATVGATKAGSIFLSPVAPNETIKDIADTVLDFTKTPDFVPQHWVNGRTALLIAKTNEVLNQGLTPPGAKAAIVMGNAHNIEGRELLHDDEKRREAIFEYAQEIVTFYKKVLEKFPYINKTAAINRMLDAICEADMLAVTDPQVEQTDNPRMTLNNNIQHIGKAHSREIFDAIASLRVVGEDIVPIENYVNQPPTKSVPQITPVAATPVPPTPLPPGVIIPKPPR